MYLRFVLVLAVIACAMTASAQIVNIPTPDSFQVRYASNLNIGDSFVNITNTGASTTATPGVGLGYVGGNLCVNTYVFDQSEELLACCYCFVTPNGLASYSVKNQLIINNLTPEIPNSVVIKLVATAGPNLGSTAQPNTACNPGGPIVGLPPGPTAGAQNLAPGMRAWGTSLHALPTTPVTYGITETAFSPSDLSLGELTHLTSFCSFIQTGASGFGVCKGCGLGGLGAGTLR